MIAQNIRVRLFPRSHCAGKDIDLVPPIQQTGDLIKHESLRDAGEFVDDKRDVHWLSFQRVLALPAGAMLLANNFSVRRLAYPAARRKNCRVFER